MAETQPQQQTVDPFAGMDFGGGLKGGVQVNGSWVPANHPLATQNGAPGAPPASPTAGAATTGTGTGPNGQPLPNANQPTIQQTFQNQLQSILSGPSADQAGLGVEGSPQGIAYKNQQQRTYEREAQQLAEENALAGGDVSNPALSMGLRGMRQQQGEQSGQFMAGLSDKRIADRRGELQNAMAMAAALGDATAARALQMQIAELDASTRNRATDVNKELGLGDMDVRRTLGLADIDLRRYGIDTQRDVDMTGLGLDAERLRMDGDRMSLDSILSLLR
jgi:hypothetical protein